MAANKRNMSSAEMANEVLDKIAQFSDENRPLAERIHKTIIEANPSLCPRLWYGMPGYARTKDSAVLCFFREDAKYMTFGLTESVEIEPEAGAADKLMPCAWYFTELDAATEQSISRIVKQNLTAV